MNHICPDSNMKWDCGCGKCGYEKTKKCLYHQHKARSELTDSLIKNYFDTLEVILKDKIYKYICKDGVVEVKDKMKLIIEKRYSF